jgi:phasin
MVRPGTELLAEVSSKRSGKQQCTKERQFAGGAEMAETPYQIPIEMRDFAEKSVEQARKAFEGFMGAAHKAAGTVEGTAETVQMNAKDLTSKALAATESNVNAAFELARNLVRAKDLQEVLALQSEYLKSQIAAVQSQAKEFGSLMSSTTKK